ncbi:chaperonin CPN60-2, mitochondrial-like isoform X1 [Phoenix dactylifera]|uniref:Chaperonin CPN60-2, mitochondrial-like isoform X1 n=1 Tax=Phoenix dactylifera TaxID=42345 RepID=A0A8B9AB87_PHODC|nr:chaperonin CPN60-2, mitochondrial-like isoform X1 [Phoenix dactylifera]XP_038981188.1 chaperonin CPN60-2, mitochondrial-like isoform X1 [Phoenix dactylifera]XP_038981189.1 chaperonin CPN60-2, mitochondrial-like isoform X1 [Phoenix dactylifera]XP_038981190.1 chaperonin CPN60-2, mitochondrial-like isoform X1 [Phoenix dactylifera]
MAPKACAIKAPGFGENRTRNLGDLAILTGGEVIPEDLGLNLEKVQLEMFGAATKVTASLDDTVVQHGEGGKKLSLGKVQPFLTRRKHKNSCPNYLEVLLFLRLVELGEAEVCKEKDRVTDALNAARPAAEEGIVLGG